MSSFVSVFMIAS